MSPPTSPGENKKVLVYLLFFHDNEMSSQENRVGFSFSVLCLVVHKKRCALLGIISPPLVRVFFFFFFSCPIYLFFVWVTCFVFCVCVFNRIVFLVFRCRFFSSFSRKKNLFKFTKMFCFFFAENFEKKRTNIKLQIFFLLYACTCMCVCV